MIVEEQLFSCYGLSILPTSEVGIDGLNGEFYSGRRYVIKGMNNDQWRLLELFFQRGISESSGQVYWYNRFYCQTDQMWFSQSVINTNLGNWLAVNDEPLLDYCSLIKRVVLHDLKLSGYLHEPPYRIDVEKIASLAIASFLFQSKGMILIGELHDKDLSSSEKGYWKQFIEDSPCCVIFKDHPPSDYNLDCEIINYG
ncbi:MAG: hypothetical protein JJV97_03255 [SAR324 cluster bacterium]|nr:hypothetical protein [SAR324 cluster bacterium]